MYSIRCKVDGVTKIMPRYLRKSWYCSVSDLRTDLGSSRCDVLFRKALTSFLDASWSPFIEVLPQSFVIFFITNIQISGNTVCWQL